MTGPLHLRSGPQRAAEESWITIQPDEAESSLRSSTSSHYVDSCVDSCVDPCADSCVNSSLCLSLSSLSVHDVISPYNSTYKLLEPL